MNCNKDNWENCAIYKHGVKHEGNLFRCGFDPETEMALKNNHAGVWCLKELRPLVVFTAYHEREGRCFTTLNPGDYEEEFMVMLEYDDNEGYTEEEIMPFLERCRSLGIEQFAKLGTWTIKCDLMAKKEFDELPEWDGW